MTYNDITYCSRECANVECKRNQKHLPKGAKLVSMAEFTDCENWKEIDADCMFKALGYEKWEYEYEIGYGGKKDIVFNKPRKDIIVGDLGDYYQPAAAFTMAELKAINKKCQELGWE